MSPQDHGCLLAAAAAPRWPVRSVLAAALLTLGTYLMVPCMEMLSKTPDDSLRVRSFDTTEMPPVPVPPPLPIRDSREPTTEMPKPRLVSPRKVVLPVSLAMNLDLAMGSIGGDFNLGFTEMTPAALSHLDDTVFELFELDDPPRAVVRIQPLYPAQARMRQVEGAVVLEFVVNAKGKPRDLKVVSSAPGRIFADAAVQAVNRWRFAPGTREGQPVPVRVRQKITFRLED